MSRVKRKTLLVDPRVQGALLARIVTYWIACVLFITLPHVIAIAFVNQEITLADQARLIWHDCRPILVATLLVLPMAIYDLLKLTQRFTGPVYRLQNQLNRLAQGEQIDPLSFRDGDFWKELAEPMNKIAERLETQTASSVRQPSA